MTDITPEDTKDVTDAWPNPSIDELPEAPLSIHIDAYYQGFHAGITIRSKENSFIPVVKITSAIEGLVKAGFMPSWNQDTNTAHLKPNQPPTGNTVAQNPTAGPCQHPNPEIKISSGFKKPENKGRAYKSCPLCNEFLGWIKA